MTIKLNIAANDNLIDETCEFWNQRLNRDLSREDARQIVANIGGFFLCLREWSREEKCRANVNGSVDPRDAPATL